MLELIVELLEAREANTIQEEVVGASVASRLHVAIVVVPAWRPGVEIAHAGKSDSFREVTCKMIT